MNKNGAIVDITTVGTGSDNDAGFACHGSQHGRHGRVPPGLGSRFSNVDPRYHQRT